MWRSRRWCGVGAVAVAVVGAAALAWPAVAVAGSGAVSATPVGPGTLVVSPSGTVTASVGTILTFTFTAPVLPPPATSVSPPPANFVSPAIIVTVFMPQGWTASTPSDLTCPNSDCTPDGATATQFRVVLYPGANSFTLEVQATPPGSAGPASFIATEVAHANPPGTLPPVTSSPLNVICPADGLGTMAVDPTAVAVASSGIFTFTYTAGSCGEGVGGMVGVTVPDGWTSPGPVVAPADNLAPGAPVTFTYGPAQAGSAGPATFVAWQAAAGGPTQDLAATPVVMVTQPQVASSTATSPSLTSPSVSHAGSGGPTTVTSPQVTATPPNTSTGERAGPPVALVAYGVGAGSLVLLAGTVGLLAFRSRRSRGRDGRPRRGGHGTGGGNVRAVPHAGPPPSVAVRDTGTRPTLTVRLEPQAYATMTTIKEQGP
jgi:hypothetical protein